MQSDKRKKEIAVLLVFLILLIISAAVTASLSSVERKRNMRQAGYVMTSEISKLQYAIDSRLLNTEILEMIVVNNHGEVKEFDKMAEKLFVEDPAIRSLQLAPDGVVSYVYPLEGNEGAFGDLFDDPDRRTEAEYARDTGKMTLAGPYELSQGGMGLVARNPIYVEDQSNEEVFWGFSVAVLNVPEIFDKAELGNLSEQGYDYRIWRIHPDSGEVQIIAQSGGVDMEKAIDDKISVPNGTWTLSLQKKGGWVSRRNLILEGMVGITISALIALVILEILTTLGQKKKLAEMANTDFLTGLYNARHFLAVMKKLEEQKKPFGIVYLDLDRFKAVNDRYGHDTGDKLLIEVAARLKFCIRKNDFAFRIGGDEFAAVIMDETSGEFYEMILKRITEQIAQPCVLSDVTLYPKASCGYSRYPEDEKDVEGLIREADRKMYTAKRNG